MTPLEQFGAKVYRAWCECDCMDVDGADLQSLAEDCGVVVLEPYNIERHGEYMRDAWDVEEGELVNAPAPGIKDLIDAAHQSRLRLPTMEPTDG